MGVPNYGVWAATPISIQLDGLDPISPHIHLKFRDDSSAKDFLAAVNVRSIVSDSRVIYWLVKNLQHAVTDSLKSLECGFHPISAGDGRGLDYIRQKLVTVRDGELLDFDQPGPNNIIDKIVPILQRAVDGHNTTAFIFGSRFTNGKGIHDIHMNQGSLPQYVHGINEDGAILFYFPDSDHWEAIFLAFASQRTPTDKRGLALPGSKTLVEQLDSQ
ncbi:hypothetical protein CPC16_006075 [Podila verticillata]|nr:hypothetical protein CPC16_006075 [Podila verticillata]